MDQNQVGMILYVTVLSFAGFSVLIAWVSQTRLLARNR